MTMTNLLAWKVEEGPIGLEDLPEEYHPDNPFCQFCLVVLATRPDCFNDFFYEDLWFDTLDGALSFKRAIDSSMSAVEIGEYV